MIASYARLLQGGADYQCLRAYAAKPGPDLTPQMATTAFGILNVPNMYHQIVNTELTYLISGTLRRCLLAQLGADHVLLLEELLPLHELSCVP